VNEHDRLVDRAARDAHTVLFVGGLDAGKSTLARAVCAYALSLGRSVVYIDGDLGQKTVGPPGTVAMKRIASPDDLTLAMPAGGMIEHAMDQKRPVLHQAFHRDLLAPGSARGTAQAAFPVDLGFEMCQITRCRKFRQSPTASGKLMSENKPLLAGTQGLIMGVANNRSIAWGIAQACAREGAELAFTYQGEALRKRVEPLAASVGSKMVLACDVTDTPSLDAAFDALASGWGKIDFVVHAIAFSDKDELTGRYVDTTADNFTKTMLISCYSFTSIAQRAEKLMRDGGSLLTLTYYGAEKWMPHYNVMGVAKAALEASVRYMAADLGVKNIRVNAISAGPIKTLAAAGIGDFRYILKWNEYNSPLRRTVAIDEVGDSALYLLSRLGRAVTGEILHVDAGYHIVGMKNPQAPDITVAQGSD